MRVDVGAQVPLDLLLVEGTVLLATAVDAAGEPVRAHIRVLDSAGREVGAGLDEHSLGRALEQAFSSFQRRVGPLPPGEYTVEATTPDGSSGSSSFAVHGQPEHRVRVRLTR